MELRSQTHKKLVDFLKSAGVYEADMDIEEMHEMARVLERSTEIEPEDQQLERALLASELEFLSSQPSALHNSTMILSPQPLRRNSLYFDSPPNLPVRLTVRALVHAPMDWSPTTERRNPNRKRSVGNNSHIFESNSKRTRQSVDLNGLDQEEQPHNPDATPVSLVQGDSGVSWDNASVSSVSDTSSLLSIGEMPDRHLVSTSSVAVSDFSEIIEHNDE
ncbi:uncharacterized protein LOC108104150 [Drosophila eugracilis]|uniref:uncharacterized protein LOC108104150 n=1 Tax=Drosophila eugracilis TaxID=29029 RepID=UPI001BDB1349|nr:uncharacterized protein LOC108104150 [Drosophila eugracilis]